MAMGKIGTNNLISLELCVILSLMNKFLNMPEIFIADTSHNFLSIASQNCFMEEQSKNLPFYFGTFKTKRCLHCIPSVQLLKTDPPCVYLISYSGVKISTALPRGEELRSFFCERKGQTCLFFFKGIDTRVQMGYETLLKSLLTTA